MSRKKAPRRPKPYRTTKRFGIINPYGDVWSPQTFDTEQEARNHVIWFWRNVGGHDISKYRFVRVRVTVSAAPSPAPSGRRA